MKTSYFFLILFLFGACNLPNNHDYEFDYDIIVTKQATNLNELNTKYDDFNSDLPYSYARTDIYFSSNRTSQGVDFDIIAKGLDFTYHDRDAVLNLSFLNDSPYEPTQLLLEKVNSENDELGPYSFYKDFDLIFMYASNSNDTFNINIVEYTNWDISRESIISDPVEIAVINDFGNNLYPSINSERRKMFFCSDRNDSVYNIYSALYNNEISKETLVNGDIKLLQKEAILSSPYNDKCPYIKGDFMVFTSDRTNGFGGYDLYYSYFKNNSWTIPKLFGDKINSEYDDYRPIFFQVFQFNLMIFSSNRPGGKGMFDLYIVNIDNEID